MTIPENLQPAFFSYMEEHDDTTLTLDAWMHQILEAADRWLAEHHVDWEPRAALVFYLKRYARKED